MSTFQSTSSPNHSSVDRTTFECAGIKLPIQMKSPSLQAMYRPSLFVVLLFSLYVLPLVSSQSTLPPPTASNGLNITQLSVGFMAALTLPNVNAQTAGQPGLLAFQLALDRINKDPTLLPGTLLVGEYVDTRSDPSLSVNGAYDLINGKGIVGIIGEAQSAQSQQIQYVCKRYQISQISFGSSSMDFTTDHAKMYPFFMRPVPHVGLEATSLAYFIASQGWKKIAVAFTTDSFGASGSVATSKAAKNLGVQVLISTSWNVGATDLSFQINQLIDSKARIIVYWGVINDLLPLWRMAATMTPNIVGDGYQWLSGHSVVVPQMYTNATGSLVPDILSLSQGLMGTQYAVNWTAPEGLRMWSDWQAAAAINTNPLLTSIDKAPTNPAAAISTYASFAYDSTMLMARGLHDMIHRQGLDPRLPANRQQLYNTLQSTQFTGVTGDIRLDSNGDRGEAPFFINNLDSNKMSWQTIAQVDVDDSVHYRTDVQVQYHGANPNLKPLDAPVRPVVYVSDKTLQALQLIASIVIFLLLLLAIFIFVHRGKPVVKSASPTFLLTLLLGTMALCASIYPRTLESGTQHPNSVCVADLFLTNLGYYLLVGSLLVKTFRLKQIFLAKTLTVNRSLSDRQMLLLLIALVVFEAVMLMILSLTVPLKVGLRSFDADSDYFRCTSDSDENLVSYYLPVTITFRFVLLILTAYVSYTVRNIDSLFNESRQLLGTIYNLLFCSILLPAIDAAMDRGKNNTLIVYSACVLLICVATTAIMFFNKVKSVITNYVDAKYVTSGSLLPKDTALTPVRRTSSILNDSQRRSSPVVPSNPKQLISPRPLPAHSIPRRSQFTPTTSVGTIDTRKSTPFSVPAPSTMLSPIAFTRNITDTTKQADHPSTDTPDAARAFGGGIRVYMHPQMLGEFLEYRAVQQAQREQSLSMGTYAVVPSSSDSFPPSTATTEAVDEKSSEVANNIV